MGRSQETFNKKEVRTRKEKKRKEKEKKRLARKDAEGKNSLDDMIAYVDENGQITSEPPDPNKKKKEIDVNDIEVSVSKKDPSEENDYVRKGVVAYFSGDKGYGFIRDLQSQESIFVHINNAYDDLREGHKVTFEKGKGPKGPIAMNVKKDN